MDKTLFSDLQACINGCESRISYVNQEGKNVFYNVKHYLPFSEKLELVSRVINQSIDDNGFYNPMRIQLFLTLEVVYAYTNLSFTDEMKEDPFSLYDILVSTGIFIDIVNAIWEKDWEDLQKNVQESIKSIYKYKNSVMGILDTVSSDYSNLNLDITELTNKLTNASNLSTIKEVMEKLG